jgi:hypothetical protein
VAQTGIRNGTLPCINTRCVVWHDPFFRYIIMSINTKKQAAVCNESHYVQSLMKRFKSRVSSYKHQTETLKFTGVLEGLITGCCVGGSEQQ